ncbi:MAG: DNA repair protein RecO [Pseudomonadota bacterium]
MHWNSEAIVLKQNPFNDDKLLCWIFSETDGLYKGLISLNKKTRNQIQVGNIVNANWKARLPEHMGSFFCELIKPISIEVLNDKLKLSSISSLCAILASCLPERVSEPRIYKAFYEFLSDIKNNTDWLGDYIRFETLLLQELGFALNFNSCAVTGATDGLYYVSPKTGMAVTKEAGEAYRDKLLKLPKFLLDDSHASKDESTLGLELTYYFINKHLYKSHNREIPAIRTIFYNMVCIN